MEGAINPWGTDPGGDTTWNGEEPCWGHLPSAPLLLLAAGASATVPKQDSSLKGIHHLPTSPVALAVAQGSQLGPLSPGSQG